MSENRTSAKALELLDFAQTRHCVGISVPTEVLVKYKALETALEMVLNEAKAGNELQGNKKKHSFVPIIKYAERVLSLDPLQ